MVLIIFIAADSASIVADNETANFSIPSAFIPSTCLNASIKRIIVPAIVSSKTIDDPSFMPFVIFAIVPNAVMMPPRPSTPLVMVLASILPMRLTANASKFTATAIPIKPLTLPSPEVFFMKRDISRSNTSIPIRLFAMLPVSSLAIFFIARTSRLIATAKPKKPVFPVNPLPAIRMKRASSVMITPIARIPFNACSVSIAPRSLMGITSKVNAAATIMNDFPFAPIFPNRKDTLRSSTAIIEIMPSPFTTSSVSILART